MEMEKGNFRADPPGWIDPGTPPPPYPSPTAPPNIMSPLDPSTTNSAIAVSSLISQDGRASLFTLCPHCVTQVHTTTQYAPNQRVQTAGKGDLRGILMQILFFAIIMVVFILLIKFGFGAMISGMPEEGRDGFEKFLLIPILMFSLFFIIIIMAICWHYFHTKDKIANNYHDVTHTCPLCRKTLGVCDGYHFYEEDKRQRKLLAALRSRNTHTHHHH